MDRNKVKTIDNKVKLIYCADGPLARKTISGVVDKRKIAVPLHSNPFYESAVYFVTGATNSFSEHIAVFSHCRRRKTNE
jgi:hypothetical protein